MSQDLELLYNKNDIYTEYSNDDFDYYYPTSFDNRNKCYLISRYTPKAMWDYGDTVTIIFNIHETNLTVEEIANIDGKKLLITFYNERYEKLDFQYENDAQIQTSVFIDYETSMKQFKRGVYHCMVQLITYEDNEIDIAQMQTILPMEDCSFYVQ